MDCATKQLIDNIKKHTILYDSSHPSYKNNRIKNVIWEEIGTLLDIDGDEAKKRWKNIRDCYAKHLRSEKSHTGQQSKNISRYRSWPWAAQMSAFKPFLQFAQTSNVDVTVNDDTGNSPEEHHTMKTETHESSSSRISPLSSPMWTAPQSSQSNFTSQVLKKSAAKRKIQDNDESSVCQGNALEGMTYDDLDLLFLGHAGTIKKLSAKRQVIAKYRVAQVLMEEELNHIEETTAATLPSTSGTN